MAGLTVMKKFSKEKLHLPKIDGITLRWLINIIGVIVVFFIIVFIIPVHLQLLSVISVQILMRVTLLNSQPQNILTAIVIRKKLLPG